MNKKISKLGVIIAFMLALSFAIGWGNILDATTSLIGIVHGAVTEADTESSSFEIGTVVQVVDGDTLIVNIDGTDQRVRLIGVDALESVNPDKTKNTPEGDLASAFMKMICLEGTIVWLETDVSDTDRYDRLLRYVYLQEPAPDVSTKWLSENMINAILVMNGHAVPRQYEPDIAYTWLFEMLE